MLSGFRFKEELEERLIAGLSVDEATSEVAEAEKDLADFKKEEAKKNKRKSKGKGPAPPSSETSGGKGETSGGKDLTKRDPGSEPKDNAKSLGEPSDDEETKSAIGSDPSDPSDPSDDSDDERKKTSRNDKARIRGRTPRVETGGKSKKKLFKMDPPSKYAGEKDKDRTYDAVQLFLSQLSRYFRLATDIDLDGDIAEYAGAFLDGFAYTWFENLDKGNVPFLWKNFEAVMRKKFIPFAHIQRAITKYNAIKQTDGKSVAEYIVEREAMEGMLGDALSPDSIAGSFRENLHPWIREKLTPFADLPYDQYKHKAEVTDQDAQEQKVGPWAKKGDAKSTSSTSTSKPYGRRSGQSGGNSGGSGNAGKPGNASPKSSGKGDGKKRASRQEMRKKGICFNCSEQGHIAKNCPHPRRDDSKSASAEVNSIRIAEDAREVKSPPKPTASKKKQRKLYDQKRDERSYRDVVTGKATLGPTIPAIGLKETTATPETTKPKPMFTTLEMNGVKAKILVDTGSSADFVGTHFATTNRLSVRNREQPVSIQQAIKGSKPKTNATTKVEIKFGEWTKVTEAHVAGLAGYDAIIGVPTLTDGGAIIDVPARKVYFKAWDFTVDCEVPDVPPKPPRKVGRWMGGKKGKDAMKAGTSSLSKGRSESRKMRKAQVPRVAPATASITTSPGTTASHPPPPPNIDTDGSPSYYEALLLEEFEDLLVNELPNKLPPLREVNHTIPYKGTKPFVARKYRLSEDRKKALEEDVRRKLESGILEYSSDVPLAASHMVPKSEPGKFRHVQDLRKRNEDTESMSWPLPDQEELVHNVAQSDNVSTVDLISAFDQTRNELESEKYSTIINHLGVFKQRTIQQGDKNAVATHQRSMQHHTGEQWGQNVTFYVDDGAIYDKKPGMTVYSHYLVCRRFLLNFRRHKFYLNRKKTKFFVDMKKDGVELLGRHIQNGEISIAKPKVDAFLALGSPTSHQELGKDLGTFNWLTDHLPWAASVAAPLQELYHSPRWEWREVHENAFRRMKELIGGAEVLVPLDLREEVKDDPEKRIFVVSDASLSGGGGYICQGKSLETATPAVYHSRVFTPAQTNYPVHEQELLALVDIVKSYEHWLLGRSFTAVTDSQAMLSLMKQKHLSPRQWRAMTYLSTFDMKFEFLPGKRNIIADLLSRIAERSTYRHDLPYLDESDETAVAAMQLRRGKTLLEAPVIKTRPPKATAGPGPSASESGVSTTSTTPSTTSTTPVTTTAGPRPAASESVVESVVAFDLSGFRDAIIAGYEEDTLFKKALKEGVQSGVYELRDELLYTGPGKDELCIPNVKVNGGRDGGDKNLREMIISHFHDGILGHFGFYKTITRVRREFYWKTMMEDIKKYVRSCHTCQTRKTSPTKQYGKNHPLPTPTAPWDQVSMDFLVNLPSSSLNDQKFNSLFVVVDMLSKQAHLIPTTTNVKAEGVAKLYFDQIYRLHGLPRAIVSDRDTKFTGAFWRTLQKMVGTDLMMSTTDHPQTDGQTERTNRTIIQILRAFVNQVGSDWAQHLAAVEFAVNSAVSRSTGKAPFEVIYGYLPRSFPPIAFDHDNPASMDFMEDRMLAQLSAQDAIIAAKTEQSYHVNKHRKEDPDIAVGQDIVVSNESQLQHLPKGRQKLAAKWVGPYKVLKVDKSKSNYTVEIPNSKRHPTFHVSYVKPYTDPQLELFPNRQRRRPRIVTSEYDLNVEVEKLIGHQKRRDGSIQFLVRWEGYPAEDATYRDAQLFKTSPYGIRVVEDYLATFGDLPDELDVWVAKTDWVKARKTGEVVAEATTATTATRLVDSGAAEDGSREVGVGGEESSALWIMLELGDLTEDSDEEDFVEVDTWSVEGRM